MNKPKTISLLVACGLAWIISTAGCNLFYHDDNKGQCTIEELCTDWRFITINEEPLWPDLPDSVPQFPDFSTQNPIHLINYVD